MLPPRVAQLLDDAEIRNNLTELVLDEGRPPLARCGGSAGAELWEQALTDEPLTAAELRTLCTHPVLTTWTADNCACVEGTLHRASRICNLAGEVIGATLRVGRYRFGLVEKIEDLLRERRSTILLGPADAGKTMVLREYARVLSDLHGYRVVVIDTFNEIAGGGNTAHPSVGARTRRLMVPHRSRQHEVMMEAVHNHNPEVLIIDEIGTKEEALAAASIAQSGISLVSAVHGRSLEELIDNPVLDALLGGLRPASEGAAATRTQGRAKRVGTDVEVRRRIMRPPFQSLIELHPRVGDPEAWRLYRDLAGSVDRILQGEQPISELRLPPEQQRGAEVSSYSPGVSRDNVDEGGLEATRLSLSDANISKEAYSAALQGGAYVLEFAASRDEDGGACGISAVLSRVLAGDGGYTVSQGQWQLYLPAQSTEEQMTLGAKILGLTGLRKEWASLQPRPQLLLLLDLAVPHLAALKEAPVDEGVADESAAVEERVLVLRKEVQKLLADVPSPVQVLPDASASRGPTAAALAQQAVDGGAGALSVLRLAIVEALVAPMHTLPDWARAVAMAPKLQPARAQQVQEQPSLLPWQLEENQAEPKLLSSGRNLEGDALFMVVQKVLRRVRKLKVRTRYSYVSSGRTLDVEEMEKLLQKMEELQQEFKGRFPVFERSSGVARTMQNLETARNKVFGMQGRVLTGGFKVVERLGA